MLILFQVIQVIFLLISVLVNYNNPDWLIKQYLKD